MVNTISTPPSLARELGLFAVTLMGIGIILGAGIYALLGEATAIAGEGVWLSFILAALVTVFTGLSYAELSSMFPKAGAEFEFVKNAFSNRFGFLCGWLIVIAGVVSVPAVAIGFGRYFNAITGLPVFWSALGLIVLCALILFLGVKQSVWIGGFFTVVEALGLIIIVVISVPFLGNFHPMQAFDWPGIFSAAALVFFAFIGFEEIVQMSEETRDAEKTIPRALLIAIAISTLLYVLVAVSSVSVLGANALGQSKAPLADVATKAFGPQAFAVLSIIALFSTSNTVLLIMLAMSRMVYGMSKGRAFPDFLSKVHEKTKTPVIAISAVTLASAAFLLINDLRFVAEATDFLLFVVFIMVNLAVIKLRFDRPEAKRPFKSPSLGKWPILPVFGILTIAFLLFHVRLEVALLGMAFVIAGEIYYRLTVRGKKIELKAVS